MALSYCGEYVRTVDPDRFFCSLLARREHQEALWALLAFYHEIAKTREIVSETQLGLIRLQWWREAVGRLYHGQGADDHEVLLALAPIVQRYNLPLELFEAMIYAREFDLEDVLPGSLDGLRTYLVAVGAPLLRLAVTVTGEAIAQEDLEQVVVNYGVVGLVRSIPAHAMVRRCYMPQDILARHDVRVNQLYDLKQPEGMVGVVSDVMDLYRAKNGLGGGFVKAHEVLAGLYRGQIARCGMNIFDSKLAIPLLFKELRVFLLTKLS